MADSSNLRQIFNFSMSLNHLVSMSLMRDENEKYEKMFVYLTFRLSDGDNKYNIPLSFKLSAYRIAELGHALKIYARNQVQFCRGYSIIVDSSKSQYNNGQGGIKSAILNLNKPESDDKSPTISIVVKGPNTGKGRALILPIPTALVLADACDKLFQIYLEELRNDSANYSRQPSVSYGANRRPQNNNTNNQCQQQPYGNPDTGSESSVGFLPNDELPF